MTYGSPSGVANPGHRAGEGVASIGRPTAVDMVSSAVVLSIAATAWFVWGMSDDILRVPLLVGAAAGLGSLALAVARLRRAQGPSTMATDPRARRMYWIGTGGEIIAIPPAFVLLSRAGLHELMPAVVLAIVALHFIPLAIAFRLRDLWWVIVLCLAVSAASITVFVTGLDGARALAGGLGGAVMLACAVTFVLRARRPREPVAPRA